MPRPHYNGFRYRINPNSVGFVLIVIEESADLGLSDPWDRVTDFSPVEENTFLSPPIRTQSHGPKHDQRIRLLK